MVRDSQRARYDAIDTSRGAIRSGARYDAIDTSRGAVRSKQEMTSSTRAVTPSIALEEYNQPVRSRYGDTGTWYSGCAIIHIYTS
jgi:hypothetical protein